MGFDSRSWQIAIHWKVSRHNSRWDKIDDLLEEEFAERLDRIRQDIDNLVADTQFSRLGPFVV